MKIHFCGAAQTVTGSQHLIDIDGYRLLLDCGLSQGKRKEAFALNREFLFEPQTEIANSLKKLGNFSINIPARDSVYEV